MSNDYRMEQEFYVDGIVAERKFPDGVKRYLIKWEDYPHTDNTWEPKDHLQNDTLEDWRDEQARVQRGESQAFDVEEWEIAVERRLQKREARERKAKLKALVEKRTRNLDTDDLDDIAVRDDKSQSSTDDEFIAYYKPRKRRLISDDEDEPTVTSPRQKSWAVERVTELTSPVDITMESNEPAAVPQADMSLHVEFSGRMRLGAQLVTVPASTSTAAAKRDPTNGKPSKEAGAVSVADAARQLKPARKAVKGAGPARLANAMPANIFNDWNRTVRKRNRKSVSKQFNNPSHAWNTEKLGRTEPEPDIGSLELVSAKDGSVVKPLHLELQTKRLNVRAHGNSLDEGDSLFLSQSPPDLTGSFLRRLPHNVNDAGPGLGTQKAQEGNYGRRQSIPQTGGRESEDLMKRTTRVAATSGTRRERNEAGAPDTSNQHKPGAIVAVWGPHTRHLNDIAKDIDPAARKLYGTLIVGITDPEGLRTIFQGIPPPWWGIFLRVKPEPASKDCFVHITQLCTSQGYIRDYHYGGQGYYAAGWIPPWPRNIVLAKFQAFLSILRDPAKQYGGLFFSEHYTLLVYAPVSSNWDFIDKLFSTDSPSGALRFVMRAPVPAKKPEITTEEPLLTHPPVSPSKQPFPAQPAPERKTAGISPLDAFVAIFRMAGTPEQDRVFREALGFDWKELLPANRPNGELPALFLHYDTAQKAAKEELSFMRGLFQDTFRMRVYSSDCRGEWALFCDPVNINSGVILFHTSISHYENISDLAKILKFGNYHCWRIELRLKPERSILQKIFPSGGAILIPDSLILRKPDMVVRILRWYRKVKVPAMHTSKWSLVMRPRFRKWIHAIIANEGSNKREKEELTPYKDILAQLMLAFPLATTYDSETDLERPSPDAALVDPGQLELYDENIGPDTQDLQASQGNDDLLVKWFAKWSLQQVDKHRKFYIVFDGYGENHDSDHKFGSMWARSLRHVSVVKSKEFVKEAMERDEARFADAVKKKDGKDIRADQN